MTEQLQSTNDLGDIHAKDRERMRQKNEEVDSQAELVHKPEKQSMDIDAKVSSAPPLDLKKDDVGEVSGDKEVPTRAGELSQAPIMGTTGTEEGPKDETSKPSIVDLTSEKDKELTEPLLGSDKLQGDKLLDDQKQTSDESTLPKPLEGMEQPKQVPLDEVALKEKEDEKMASATGPGSEDKKLDETGSVSSESSEKKGGRGKRGAKKQQK